MRLKKRSRVAVVLVPEPLREPLEALLKDDGYGRVLVAGTLDEAEACLMVPNLAWVFLDPEETLSDTLSFSMRMHEEHPDCPAVVVAAEEISVPLVKGGPGLWRLPAGGEALWAGSCAAGDARGIPGRLCADIDEKAPGDRRAFSRMAGAYMLRARPWTARTASGKTSLRVGWGYMVLMGVDRHLTGQQGHGGGDQLSGLGPDDVDAEDLAVLGLADDLDEAVGLADDVGLGHGHEGEDAALHVVALGDGGLLGEADAAHFGIAVGATGHLFVVDGGGGEPRHPAPWRRARRRPRPRPGHVGQPGGAHDVADGIEARLVGLQERVDVHGAAIHDGGGVLRGRCRR